MIKRTIRKSFWSWGKSSTRAIFAYSRSSTKSMFARRNKVKSRLWPTANAASTTTRRRSSSSSSRTAWQQYSHWVMISSFCVTWLLRWLRPPLKSSSSITDSRLFSPFTTTTSLAFDRCATESIWASSVWLIGLFWLWEIRLARTRCSSWRNGRKGTNFILYYRSFVSFILYISCIFVLFSIKSMNLTTLFNNHIDSIAFFYLKF